MAAKHEQVATASARGLGLRIARAELQSLGRRVSSALQRAFQLPYVRQTILDKGSYDLYYFTINPPVDVKSEDQTLPCLPGLAPFGIWIVVEIRVGREGGKLGEQFVEHISIKSFKGPTSESATLLFRAEWDPRDSDLNHAQPHWNIHAEAWEKKTADRPFPEYVSAQTEPGFEEWIAPVPTSNTAAESAEFEHHKIHFALGSSWQIEHGTHSSTLAKADDATRWIEGCCTYIKSQFDSLANRK